MPEDAIFWDRLAEKYSRQPIKDETAYRTTLDRVRAYLSPSDSVLEVGCGTGTTAIQLATSVASYRGTDISGGMIEIARRKAKENADSGNPTFDVADVRQSIDQGPYDVIMGFNLIHLLEDPSHSLALMAHALKPGGRLITKTPCLRGMGWHVRLIVRALHLIGRAPYVQFLSQEDLEQFVRDAGLEILETGDYPAKPPSHFVVASRA